MRHGPGVSQDMISIPRLAVEAYLPRVLCLFSLARDSNVSSCDQQVVIAAESWAELVTHFSPPLDCHYYRFSLCTKPLNKYFLYKIPEQALCALTK